MQHSPALAQQLVALHGRDRIAAAGYARLVAQTRSPRHQSTRKETSMQLISTVYALGLSLLLNPRAAAAATALAAAIALVAGFVLDPESASAQVQILGRGGRGGWR